MIASGGVGTLQHLHDGITKGGASALLAASIFHFGDFSIFREPADYEIQGIKLVQRLQKIEIGGFETLEAPFVGAYVHGNKIGALTGLSKATDNAPEVAKSVSMQVASMGATTLSYKDFDPAFVASETEARIAAIEKENEELGRLGKTLKNVPQYISMSQLTPEVMAKAEEDIKAELKAEGKPEKIWDKIVPGKIDRFISDNTTMDHEKALLDQNFIMDDSMNVAKYVASQGDAEVVSFKRITLV